MSVKMVTENSVYSILVNKALRRLMGDALMISLRSPSMAGFILRTIIHQNKAARLRNGWNEKGVQVPPYMIVSITGRCNLNCRGCYAREQHRVAEPEMAGDRLRGIIKEAKELGISIILLAGGEPLMRPEILDITKDFPEIVFPLFTNGLLIDGKIVKKLKTQKNVVPVISLEGYKDDTDGRRGKGVYEHLLRTMSGMKGKGIFYGTSLTVTRSNFSTLTSRGFIEGLINSGSKLFFFVEYVPFKVGTEDWVITNVQRFELLKLMNTFRTEFPGLFIAFPGDEEKYGGCMSAGRGFVHVSSGGNLEPCPFAPYSDKNLKDMTLLEALQSRFLEAIRRNHEQLTETNGGCALWEKREWVQSLLQSN